MTYEHTSLNKSLKKQKTKINNVKYSKKLKKYFDYTVNVKTDTENIDLNKDYAKKTVVLLKDAVNKIFKSE